MTSGVHVRTAFFTDPSDPNGDCMFQLQLWPLPQEIVQELGAHLDAVASQWLQERKMVGLGRTDLKAVGPTQ